MFYLTANNMVEDNLDWRKAIFLSETGKGIYLVMSDLCSPEQPASKTLEQQLKNFNVGSRYRSKTKQWRSQRGQCAMTHNPGKMMIGNGGQITGCVIFLLLRSLYAVYNSFCLSFLPILLSLFLDHF